MQLTIKEAARMLAVSESKVRSYIVSGQLQVKRKGRQILIREAELKALLDAEKGSGAAEAPTGLERMGSPAPEGALEDLGRRLAALEKQLSESGRMQEENQRLHQLLREQDKVLAEKDLEIEKLRRDLVYQRRLGEKELEDRRRTLQEKWALLEKEASERIGADRKQLEHRLTEERDAWSERLAREREQLEQKLQEERNLSNERLLQEQELCARRLAILRNQEGFWARLMKMITWS